MGIAMNRKNRKILIIDDNRANLILLQAHAKNLNLEALITTDPLEGIQIAKNEQPDMILLDIMMPEIDGFETCKRLKSDPKSASIPVIFVSSKDQPCDKVEGLRIGAIDYITKPFNEAELKARVSLVLKMVEMQEELLSLANTDELTRLSNRRYFFNILEREILRVKIKDTKLAIMILDVDHFKSINDTYGHLAGDMILKQMGKILQENIYPLDVAARYGGEEFIILMPNVDVNKAINAAERLRQIIDQHQWDILEKTISITASIGVTCVEARNIISSHDIVEKADNALYIAKRNGRNRVVCSDQIKETSQNIQSVNREYQELQNKALTLSRQLREQALGTIRALTTARDMVIKDEYLARHGENVRHYAMAIAKQMSLSTELEERIGIAALLQDLGKISIPREILKKTTPLTNDEHELIRQHPMAATEILKPINCFELELQMIKHHHENFDGTGYPSRLKGREIPIGSRILIVADAFDAITSGSEYRQPQTLEYAIEELFSCTHSQFDPDVVDALVEAVKQHSDWPLSENYMLAGSSR